MGQGYRVFFEYSGFPVPISAPAGLLQGVKCPDFVIISPGPDSNLAVILLKSLTNPWTKIVGIARNLVLILYNFYCSLQ